MEVIRAAVMGGVVGVFGMFLMGLISHHVDFIEVDFLVLGVGAAVGFVTGFAAGHNRDPIIGALAAVITGVAVVGGLLISAELSARATLDETAVERGMFTYADNTAFWAIMNGENPAWPDGWSYSTATELDHLPQAIRDRAKRAWESMGDEEHAHHMAMSGVHDVRVIAARAAEIEQAWTSRGHTLDPAPGDPDHPDSPIWDQYPEEVWRAAVAEWEELDEAQREERRQRQLDTVRSLQGEAIAHEREARFIGLVDAALVMFSMVLAFGFAAGHAEDEEE